MLAAHDSAFRWRARTRNSKLLGRPSKEANMILRAQNSYIGLACLLLGSLAGRGAAETPAELLDRARGALTQIEGTIRVPGLREPVEVLRDGWGVPHIYAKHADDLFFAQGFVAAQDRLFQIDLWRRTALGETAEVVGKSGLAADRFARLLKYR